jgi:hypothetical protein
VSNGEYLDLKPRDIALIVAAAASSKDQDFENVAVFPSRRYDETTIIGQRVARDFPIVDVRLI